MVGRRMRHLALPRSAAGAVRQWVPRAIDGCARAGLEEPGAELSEQAAEAAASEWQMTKRHCGTLWLSRDLAA